MEDNLDKKTILIVDDEKTIVDMLVYNLQREGYNTLEANDGETAVNIALDKKPDLVLLDIMIPKMDGLAVCKRIRQSLNMPIIMISAQPGPPRSEPPRLGPHRSGPHRSVPPSPHYLICVTTPFAFAL